jgi:S-adenosylmethionine:tRNA ribosyltransferase-isomerase
MNAISEIIQFTLPEHLACPKPTEERGIGRDEVRLLVTTGSAEIEHTTFSHLDKYLQTGDILVVNTSAMRASALPVSLPGGRKGMVHVSNRLNAREWLIEIREIRENKTIRWKEGEEEMRFHLPDEASVILRKRFYKDRQLLDLWVAEFATKPDPEAYLAKYAQPIRYNKLNERYPLSYYQTFFSLHPGSSEMPSAGRGFTRALVERLLKKGIVFAPVLLHTGVSSLEENESPYPEYMEISPVSAALINTAKELRKRIIAVGTTTVRAVESAVDRNGVIGPYVGSTDLFIDETRVMKVVDGLLTGFHEPRASHLKMIQALAGFEHVDRAYRAALDANYYWHQFGDLHLILPK